MVIVAVRFTEEVLAVALTVTVPSYEPDVGDIVSHDAEPRLTVQLVLDEIVKVHFWPEAESVTEACDTVRVGDAAACVTLMLRVIPPPVMVMVAVRFWKDVFVVAVTVTVPLFEPEDG